MRALLAALCCALAAPLFAQTPAQPQGARERSSFWERDIWSERRRGFLFYEIYEEPREAAPPAQPAPPARPKALSEMDHDELTQERERRLKAAVMDPTPEKMTAYLEVNTFMLRKSSAFADMWRRTVWANPQFDFNVMNPQANFAQTQIRVEREQRKRAVVADLGRDYGLLFFYRSDCPYCKLQAPVVRQFSSTYGVQVLAVSLDGGGIAEFPDARPDNGISQVVSEGRGIDFVPALYLVSRNEREFVQLGAGVMAIDEIVERVNVLTQQPAGSGFAGAIR